MPGLIVPLGVNQPRAFLGQHAGIFACQPDFRKHLTGFPRKTLRRDQLVKLLQGGLAVSKRLIIDGEHAAGFADADHGFACQPAVNIPGQGGDGAQVLHMRLVL